MIKFHLQETHSVTIETHP